MCFSKSPSQALMSSPQALAAQMENMAKKGTLPIEAAVEARRGADAVPQPAKLIGLLQICDELRRRQPTRLARRCVHIAS